MILSPIVRGLVLSLAVAALTACAGTGFEHDAPTQPRPTENRDLSDRERDDAADPLPAARGKQPSDPVSAPPTYRVDAATSGPAPGDELAGIAGQLPATTSEEPVQGQTRPPQRPLHERTETMRLMTAQVAGNLPSPPRAPIEPIDRENYGNLDPNPVRLASEHPVSTFSIDVDTGAYSNVRRFLNDGRLPPHDAVRIEELINYFSYDYPTPRTPDVPFTVITELAETPWNPDTMLLHVGLKGFEVTDEERPASNLVFLIDVSGSMRSADKLPLLIDALSVLTQQLDERDIISIAAYAGGPGLVLEPTSGGDKRTILDALESLTAAGRTNGAAGIHLAYELAEQAYVDGGINRVILATDGDFNVGTVDFDALVDLISQKRENGVALTALGFGTGNYNDHLLEQLADAGNGNYAYIDGQREARKVLVEEMAATLQTIAKDVKIQIEFNPDVVAEYRLIGYENRLLRREDFNNDRIDAGEIGAGHSVTALYEVTLNGSPAQLHDPLRYGSHESKRKARGHELAFVRLRFKQPEATASTLIERPVTRQMLRRMDSDFRFAAAVAAFGQRLRGGDYLGDYDYDRIAALAQGSLGRDDRGHRHEFVALVERAMSLGEPLATMWSRDHRIHVAN